MIDDKSLDELERLAKAATPGPWGEWSNRDDYSDPPVYEVGVLGPLRMYNDGSGGCTNDFVCETTLATYPEGANDKNAAFIAAANPQTVLALVERLRLLEGIVRSLAVSAPDVNEGGELWCAVCDTEIHKDWPSLDEHREDCPYRRSREAAKP